jgi:hypothetical protein
VGNTWPPLYFTAHVPSAAIAVTTIFIPCHGQQRHLASPDVPEERIPDNSLPQKFLSAQIHLFYPRSNPSLILIDEAKDRPKSQGKRTQETNKWKI